MIEFVEGELAVRSPSFAVVKCGGLGYRVTISLSTFDVLPPTGDSVRLWTHLQLRDEEVSLFGFASLEERWLFQQLISVNGVGPKLAITMLSAAKSDTIRRAVAEGDSATLKGIPKIGAKIADRIVLELKKKVGLESGDLTSPSFGGPGQGIREATDALVSLGFSRSEAERAVENAHKQGAGGTEELVKHALRSN